MLTVYELIFFFQTGSYTETITLDWKGEKVQARKYGAATHMQMLWCAVCYSIKYI